MNWGYKILIIYSAFVLGIVFMVYKSTQQNIDLVTTDYYAKELVYQDRIDEAKRTSLLSAPVTIVEKNRQLEVTFPKEFADFFIKFTTTKGDLVLDPFAGSNTTGSSAEKLERKWIAMELDENYLERVV